MELSFVGLAVFTVLFLIGWWLGSGVLIGLMASLPFGSTAFVQLPALGGSTPLIYTLFALVLLTTMLLPRKGLEALRSVFARQRSAWVVASLMLLAIVGTLLFPNLFAGETVALLPVAKVYREFPLHPSSKNVTQGGYFLLGALVYFAVATMLLEKPRRALILEAFFAFCIAQTACGLVDLVAKYGGESDDVFASIRTANYTMLSKDLMAGFPRLTGALPEASSFAVMTLSCLGFAFVYWRGTGSLLALSIATVDMVLIFVSTSSTAYVGFVILCLPLALRIVGSMRRGVPLGPRDRQSLLFGLLAAVVSLVIFMTYDRPSSVVDLMNMTVFQKHATKSGIERFHFNAVSMRNLFDTYGLGVGLGSSRASSWPIAVLGQLGVAGTLLMTVLVGILVRGMRGVAETPENAGLIVAGNAVCASAVAGLVGASISAGSADPGILFFIALAVVTSWREQACEVDTAREAREWGER